MFAKLTNTPDKRLVMLGDGTHAIVLEKNRLKLIDSAQGFLEDRRWAGRDDLRDDACRDAGRGIVRLAWIPE